MGNGGYSTDITSSISDARRATNTNFAYSSAVRTGKTAAKPHPTLDPKKANGGAGILAGTNVHESRDNDDHPNSKPIAVFFDVTASMGGVPDRVQQDLTKLFALILIKGYLADPQIAIGGIGDSQFDQIPFQFSQFESDNRIDDNLDNIVIEGGGGGNGGESYGLALYALAHKTAHDAWDRRQQKGYAFLIGDECGLQLTTNEIEKEFGDIVQKAPTLAELYAQASEQWEVFFLHINNYTAHTQNSARFWKNIFGDHFLTLESETITGEVIAGTVGMLEGKVDLSSFDKDLADVGSTADRDSIGRALSNVSTTPASTALARSLRAQGFRFVGPASEPSPRI